MPGLRTWRTALTLAPAESDRSRDAHHLYRLVLSGFGGDASEGAGSTGRPAHVLFAPAREEPPAAAGNERPDAGRPVKVLVQSPQQPNWQPLLDDGRLSDAYAFTREYTYRAGQSLQLRVIANPSRKLRSPTRRVSLTDPAQVRAWLHRRLLEHGLSTDVGDIAVGPPRWIVGAKGSGDRFQLVTRTLQTGATVLDAAQVHDLLRDGLGQGKSYGCGLVLTHANRPAEQ
ncbi:type I-E CRISPR-associated protein Cas6/Cse3/CasE [Streptomyces sp. NBC_01390]|uniref:type I-E CRISPR-associated protein Cas6/Cse3/CasE n=1 Tax=Streptomyces sp. NBC_01390 TaxID=2903850 RepID=UPI003248195F